MKINFRLAALIAASLIASNAAHSVPAAAQAEANAGKPFGQTTQPPTDTLIVKFKTPARFRQLDGVSTARAQTMAGAPVAPLHVLSPDTMQMLSAQAGLPLSHQREMSGEAHVLKLPQPLPYDEAASIAKRLEQLGEVEYAEPSGRRTIAFTPNDPRYGEQWHYSAPVAGSYGANLPAAWDVVTGSASIVIAVIDTGILFDHPDLVGRTVPGYDFITDCPTARDQANCTGVINSRDSDASDPGDWSTFTDFCGSSPSSWHGTHVAGTIGANSNNGVGVAGINWVSKILPIRVLGKCGGDDADIVDGLRWAAGLSVPGVPANPNPARILNMSLGGSGPCPKTFQTAIDEIVVRNGIVVVAAGNSNAPASSEAPGNCANVITVAATDRNGNRASYSNYGPLVEISAPGGSGGTGSVNAVLSALNTGTTTPSTHSYEFYNGTSMAAPHVAGVASLVLSVNPTLNPFQVNALLRATATTFPSGSSCNTTNCGAGIVNALGAVQAASSITGVPMAQRAFLPMTSRPVPPPAGSNLVNGDFEQGPGKGWISTSSYVGEVLIYDRDDLPTGPHGGDWAAWFGGDNIPNENAALKQSVIVPTNAPYLAFWHVIKSNDFCSDAYDVARVLVNGTEVKKISLCSVTNTFPNWVQTSADLSAYKGQTVLLELAFKSDATINSSWLVDDVGFQTSP